MKPPIADPFEDALAGERGSTFHYGFWKTYWWCLLAAVVGAGPFCFSVWLGMGPVLRASRYPGAWAGLLVFMLVLFVGMPFFIVPFYFLFPVKTSPQLLKCTNLWSLWREVEWSQIRKVKFFWVFLPYAVISTKQKRNFIWLPLVLKDMSGLTREVEKHTTAENPLRLFLQKRGY